MNNPELFSRTHHLFLEQGKGNFPHTIQFPLLPSEYTIPQGHLNNSMVVETPTQSLYVLRRQNHQSREHVVPHIRSEYEGTGFLGNPLNKFHMRSPEEQQALAAELNRIGVLSPKILYASGDIQVMEFLPDTTTLADLWLRNDPQAPTATHQTLETVINMNSRGITAGDRWGPNELVSPQNQIYLVDFDVAIEGPDAREFDLANILYHLGYFAHSGNPHNISLLEGVYIPLLSSSSVNQTYNKERLLAYIKGYADFFTSEKTKGSSLYYRWSDPEACRYFFDKLIKAVATPSD